MYKLKSSCFILLVFCLFYGCEKDDICVDGDTPLLVIEFYDFENKTELKAATKIRAVGVGKEVTVATFTDRTNLESISIPLKTNEAATSFYLILNSASTDDLETGNVDVVTITYVLGDEYISRACGFVAAYTEVDMEVTADSDNWIQEIEVVSTTINSDNINTTHVKIYH